MAKTKKIPARTVNRVLTNLTDVYKSAGRQRYMKRLTLREEASMLRHLDAVYEKFKEKSVNPGGPQKGKSSK